ncbi:hypothetical protein DN389_00930 [Bacillus sp. AY3-1]|uniref:hypothetical protein n=1 Tax=Bacillus sp. AY3-1 TaxID=2217817 RepID=UPI0011F07311|nr:hypothetical protein [Bacillus sp. AY3-1]KAA0750254.1 hypothetical protein DN389_00930 [Bacillus sp. AY3-1]
MKRLNNTTFGVAVGANFIFCIALYIYFTYHYELIYIHPGAPYLDTGRDLTYIIYALMLPLVIAIISSTMALKKNKDHAKLLVPNIHFSVIFLIFTTAWFLFMCIYG